MDYRSLVARMTPDVYERLKRAVELGRWPDGRSLSAEQKENALQAVIAWGELHLDAEQRVGFIDRGDKAGDVCDDPQDASLEAELISWLEGDERG